MDKRFIKFLVDDNFINVQNIILKFLKQKVIITKIKINLFERCNIILKGLPEISLVKSLTSTSSLVSPRDQFALLLVHSTMNVKH